VRAPPRARECPLRRGGPADSCATFCLHALECWPEPEKLPLLRATLLLWEDQENHSGALHDLGTSSVPDWRPSFQRSWHRAKGPRTTPKRGNSNSDRSDHGKLIHTNARHMPDAGSFQHLWQR